MSANAVQQNVLSEMQQIATQQLAMKNRLEAVVAMWGAENMAALTDQDLAELSEFAHVTAAELAAAKNGMDAISHGDRCVCGRDAGDEVAADRSYRSALGPRFAITQMEER